MKKKIHRFALLALALMLAGCQSAPAAAKILSVAPHSVSADTEKLLQLMPQSSFTYFFDLHLDESVDGISVQSWILDENHQWQEKDGNGMNGILDHTDKLLMIQVLPDQSSFSWSCDGVSSTTAIGNDSQEDAYFKSEWGMRGQDRLEEKIEVALNQPIPLLLILEKDAGAEGSTSMSINDLALVLDHPEQVDADRAVLITVTFK